MTLSRILVGVDGSASAEKALTWAARLAAALDAELLVVHATGLLSTIHGRPEPEIAVEAELSAMVSGPWSAPARALGARASASLEPGPPALALPRVAAREAVDLLVVGRRGTGRDADAFGLGSTSLQLAHDLHCPLVIVPA